MTTKTVVTHKLIRPGRFLCAACVRLVAARLRPLRQDGSKRGSGMADSQQAALQDRYCPGQAVGIREGDQVAKCLDGRGG